MLEVEQVCLRPGEDDNAEAVFAHTFAPGEISVVLGANQSGKTDLCRLIAGLNTRARGNVCLDGQSLTGASTRQQAVGMVYQAFVNYPNLTVAENIASPLRARRLSAAQIDERVTDLATRLGIVTLLDRFPHELSGGQQQRLAIARAMAKQARVLLLDEPLVNLDFKLREALEIELRELLHAAGTVVIYTSSDPRDAFSLGDQVLLLDAGHKIQAGAPLEVYTQPASFRAMELLAEPGVNYLQQHGVLCAVRPEHVRVQQIENDAQPLQFNMRVTAYETNGDESFIHGRVEEHDWVVRSSGMMPVAAGDALTLYASAGDVVRF